MTYIKAKILGFTDDVTECYRCGKQHLKGTYAVETPIGDIIYLGSTCIGHVMEYSVKETNAFIKAELRARYLEMNTEIKQATAHITDEMQNLRDQYDIERPDVPIWEWKNYGDLWEEKIRIDREIKSKYKV